MSRILALAARELRISLRSPVPYAALAVFLLLHGLFYAQYLEQFSRRTAALMGGGGTVDPTHNLMDMVAQRLLLADTFLFLLLIPAVSMRMLSEEWRSGTADLLLSYPLRSVDIVLGKFLAGATLVAAMVGLGMIHPLTMGFFGRVEIPMLLVSHAGLLCYGLVVLAIGLFFSALTENQVIAFIATMMTVLVLVMAEAWGSRLNDSGRVIVSYVSLLRHVVPASFGVARVSDGVYFAGMGSLFLFLAVSVLDARRWRGGRA